jgi:hypothetical protein
MSADRMPISRGIAPLADIPDREGSDGGPELVIRGEHPVIAMPVLPRRRHEVSETVHEDAVVRACMEMHMVIERRSEAVQKDTAPSRGRAGHGLSPSRVEPAAVQSSRSISSMKILVRAATALGRSARKQRNRFGTEITHCRTGSGGMT